MGLQILHQMVHRKWEEFAESRKKELGRNEEAMKGLVGFWGGVYIYCRNGGCLLERVEMGFAKMCVELVCHKWVMYRFWNLYSKFLAKQSFLHIQGPST